MATPSSVILDAAAVQSLLPPSSLLRHFHSFLPVAAASVHSPLRQHFSVDASTNSSLLLMPSWSTAPALPYLGVKIVTSFPSNSSLRGLPGVHASYGLFDSTTGAPLATIDGTQLTLLRTAAVSALAAQHLARADPEILVLAGAGALAPHLVRAHLNVRPTLRRVIVWNRTAAKARDLAALLGAEWAGRGAEVAFEHAEALDDVVGLGDVISCCTSSTEPVVKGRLLKPGAHLDLVGSFTPAMRECDDEAMARGRVFVDCNEAVEEAGEIVGAFERGVMSSGDVEGTLVELVAAEKVGRRSDEEVTVFKSVGSAVVDLLAAQLVYENHLQDLKQGK